MRNHYLSARLRFGGAAVSSFHGMQILVKRNHYQLRGAIKKGMEPVFSRLLTLCDSNTVFIDIGANVGIASLLVAKLCKSSVFCFEPVLGTYCDLLENINLNSDLRIVPFNLSVSNSVGFALMTSERASGINHLLNIAIRVIAKLKPKLAPRLH